MSWLTRETLPMRIFLCWDIFRDQDEEEWTLFKETPRRARYTLHSGRRVSHWVGPVSSIHYLQSSRLSECGNPKSIFGQSASSLLRDLSSEDQRSDATSTAQSDARRNAAIQMWIRLHRDVLRDEDGTVEALLQVAQGRAQGTTCSRSLRPWQAANQTRFDQRLLQHVRLQQLPLPLADHLQLRRSSMAIFGRRTTTRANRHGWAA